MINIIAKNIKNRNKIKSDIIFITTVYRIVSKVQIKQKKK